MSSVGKFALIWGAIALFAAAALTLQLSIRQLSIRQMPAQQASGQAQVTAGPDNCGDGWTKPSAGIQRFSVKNTSITGMEVYLQNVASKAVYFDIEGFGAGATESARAVLGGGSYRFVCLPADGNAAFGSTVTISGTGAIANLTPGVVPVTRNDLIPAAKAYGDWILSRLPVLIGDTHTLNTDVTAGNLDAAKRDWLTAHTEYETLGAAYGAFGDADSEINGMPASGRTAIDDPDLTGFHKIEALLYGGAPAATIAPYTTGLVDAVTRLRNEFPDVRIDPLDIGLRAHEILENALQFELTGRADAGSGSTLATIDANITGTIQALAPLRGILATRYPQIAQTDAWIARSRKLVESFRSPAGTWTPLDGLTRADREKLNATISQTVEELAPVAAICDVRRTS